MANIKFTDKGTVDGQEYNKGNTLDVDEATKSRLLKEGCIEGDASELISGLLSELANAKKLEEFKAIQEKYKKVD